MKKVTAWTLFLMLICSTGFAASEGQDAQSAQRREEVKKIKQLQKEAKKASAGQVVQKQPSFWSKEGERSGLSNIQPSIQKVVGNLDVIGFFKSEQDKYKARKGGLK